MIDKIKAWFFYKEFKVNKLKNVTPGVNPENRIIILFDGTKEDERKVVHRFKKKLNPDGKKNISSLAFIDNDLPLDNVDYAAYNRKNIKWYGIPTGPKVEDFINIDADLFLVLCNQMKPHFEYIIAHSKSKFIIGPDIKNSENYFNLIIECDDKNNLEDICNAIWKGISKISVK